LSVGIDEVTGWRAVSLVSVVIVAIGAGPSREARGQSFLESFSYDGLGLSGIGLEVGPVWSDRLTTEFSGGFRVDYGLIAPQIRLLFGASYFSGDLNDSETAKFELGIRRAISDPTGDAVVDVGDIKWSNLETNIDLQYLLPIAPKSMLYTGLGLGVHIRNGSGAVIEGSFVEDALDTIVAGLNASLGVEWAVFPQVSVTVDFRGGLTSELRMFSFRSGFMYRLSGIGS